MVIEAVAPVAITSGTTLVQLVSLRSFLNCTRYVAPAMALQVSVATPWDRVTLWMPGRARC